MQLAPMEPSPSMNEPHRQDSGRAIPVAKLLSGSPTSPKRGSAAPPAFVPAPDSSHRSPPEPFRTTSSGPYPTQQVYQPATTHYLNRAPNNHVLRQPVPRQPPHPALVNAPILPQHSRSPKVETRHEPQYSPAPTSHSSAASYYESTSDASPRTITAPPRHIPRPSKVPPLNYTLSIRQQPVAARACGFGERDRRVIDPPPILELKITDRATGAPDCDPMGMLALHCTLQNPDNLADETQVPATAGDMQSTRRLMGTLVASPYQAKDENGIAGTFFVFPDLSCRSPGQYRLHFKLLRIDPMNMQQGAIHGTVASIVTDVFSVFTAKDFPGMRASSALLKALRRQGLNVGVKKGSEARKGKPKGRKGDSSESDDDSEAMDDDRRGSANTGGSGSTGGVSPKTKSKTKRRRRDS